VDLVDACARKIDCDSTNYVDETLVKIVAKELEGLNVQTEYVYDSSTNIKQNYYEQNRLALA